MLFFIRKFYILKLPLTRIEKNVMGKYKKLIFAIIVLLFFGCSSKSDDSSSLCNAGWNTCASDENCHCWK